MKISAVVISYNAAYTIGQCLQSLKSVADEIIVIDSFSNDTTLQVCKQHQVVFSQRKFTGYGDQKNFGIAQTKHPYILSLDADEYLSKKLQQAINRLKQNKQKPIDAYKCKLVNLYKNKPLKYGIAAPIIKMRLWNKHKGLWNLAKVHEAVSFNQKVTVGFLNGCIMHQYHQSKKALVNRNNTYAKLGAQRLWEAGKKSSRITIWIKQTFAFIKAYFLKLGFLDLALGYELAKEHSRHVGLKYRLLLQMQQEAHSPDF